MKGNALKFETPGDLLSMLNNISLYNLPPDYIKKEEAFVQELTPAVLREYAVKYIDPAKLYYVVVGDAASQLAELEKLGFGKPVLIKQ
jgi:zinc protease